MLELHKKRHEYTHDADVIKRNFTDFSKADEDFDPVCLRDKKWGLIKLDIIDIAWTESQPIIKKQHLLVKLRANVPYRLHAKEGIDYFNSLLYFRYAQSLNYKQIMVNLRNNAGQTFSSPALFDVPTQTSISLVGDLTDTINDYTFYYMELVSKEDMQFEFWVEDQEGGFRDLHV